MLNFLVYFSFLPSADACHVLRDHVDPYYTEEASKHPLTVPGLILAPLSNTRTLRKRHSNKKLYSCPANAAPFALFAKATNLFVAGSTQALPWISIHYLIKILIS